MPGTAYFERGNLLKAILFAKILIMRKRTRSSNASSGVKRNSGARAASVKRTPRAHGKSAHERSSKPAHKTTREPTKPTKHTSHGPANASLLKPAHKPSYEPKKRSDGKKNFKQSHRRPHKPNAMGPAKHPVNLPELEKGRLRIVPIGGCEEVGRNMTVFEYENDIVILDIGLQFPDENMPGIDYIVPNTKYLEGKEKNIRGVIFSHGHLDHIGAAPIILEKLGYPPIIGMPLTLEMIKHRVEDHKKGNTKFLKTITVKSLKDKVKLGAMTAKFFQVEHSIMDSMGTVLETPVGSIVHAGDWTMEREEDGKTSIFYDHLRKVKRPSILMLESLGAINNGRHGTYQEMYENLAAIIKKAPGRVIIATFGSQVERVKWVIAAADKLGKKVAIQGYSMKNNLEIATKLGYVKPSKKAMIDIRKADNFPDNKVVIVCTGAQGEENAALSRIVDGTHRHVKLRRSDTIIFSSSVIPGNERTIQKIKDNIYRQCDQVLHKDIMDVHVSGHGTRRDIVDMLAQVKPDIYIPVYANHFFLKEAKWLAEEQGFKSENIFVPDNGSIFDFDGKKMKTYKEKAPSDYVFVDGLGISDSQHVVLRDRQVLAEDGMVVVIVTVDSHSGRLIQNPDIISRGFVFLKDNREVIEGIRKKVKQLVVASDPLSWADTDRIRNDIRDKVGQLVFTKTEKRPMILPVVIEV